MASASVTDCSVARIVATSLSIALLSAGLASCAGDSPEPPAAGPVLSLAEDSHDFGSVPQGTRVEHAFPVANIGSEELLIESVEAPEVFDRKDFPASLQPGETGEIFLGFDTKGLGGSGTFRVSVQTNEAEAAPHVLALSGKVVPVIEIQPQNRVYFPNRLRGSGGEQELTILNHQQRPLTIEEVRPQAGGSFSAHLETVRDGEEYRLRITLAPDAPAGRFEETIELITDSPEFPRIPVYARAWIVEEVSASPEQLRFSTVRLEDLDQDVLALKKVRIVKRDATDFEVLGASVDVPFISVRVEPEVEGQSYHIFVRVDPATADKGELQGTLTVRTNDEGFPELSVPISGTFL